MATRTHATIWIGGAAGDGIASTGDILTRTAARSGLHVYGYNSYQSVIRGGHVLFQLHISAEKAYSQGGRYDLLIALNQETADLHHRTVHPAAGRGVLFNTDRIKLEPSAMPSGTRAYGLPVGELTGDLARNPVLQNTVASGAAVFLLGLDWAVFEQAVRDQFGHKKGEVAEINLKAARRGWERAEKSFKPLADVALKGDGKRRPLMTGNQAIALGAVAGGCKFYSAYPMTPASSIMHWLAPRAEKYGMIMKQCEDEISAINMAIGAGFSGARAMTGTSGGGFSLMTEAVGLAGITETPVVIVEVQRGGPSTGLPTKSEQGDLFQVLGASQGEYPKAVLAPAGLEDCFHTTVEALNLAEKFQLPAIVMSDLLLSEHTETADPAALTNKVSIDRGAVAASPGDGYGRYRDTPSGVSPRALPGTPGGLHVAASDEHDEDGVIISDIFTNPTKRVKMMEKRMRKLDGVLAEVKRPFLKEGPGGAPLTLVGWGSTYNVLREVRLALEREGVKVDHLHFRLLWPFPAEAALKELKAAKRTVCVENNFSGLFARLVRQETGFDLGLHIRKYDGEPFYHGPLLEKVKACLGAGAPRVQTMTTSELDIPVRRVEAAAQKEAS
jgi:2-oxoglutarate/2-oxoacid ferredoxin oxidoreductase subunit alpha